MTPDGFAIRASGLTRTYGAVNAVDHVDLAIPAGQFFGLLGPNGAGKTSTVHLLSTLIRPSAGDAWVSGYDVRRQPLQVRASIGVVFQEPALDRSLTVAQNLQFAGLLNNLSRAEIRRRSGELLELFGLADQRNRRVAALSGGMRRALDIARGILHHPRVLFLDEPTIGLDVPNRRAIWRYIARLRAQLGITVFLTTHYLEEAVDCDVVAFINGGRIVRSGRPQELIEQLGRSIVEIETDEPQALAERLAPRLGAALLEDDVLMFRCELDAAALASLQAELAPTVRAVRWRRPNLNDVFLWVNQPRLAHRQAA